MASRSVAGAAPVRGPAGALRRVPFTAGVVLVMLVLAIATGTLWTGIETKSWFLQVSFGLPTLEAGRVWTVVTGSFFALVPVYYVFVAGGFGLLVGFAEWRMGTPRTALIAIGGQLVGILACAAFLAAFRHADWPWAQRLASQTDVGFSAGMMAAICVASATVLAPWGLRIRVAAIGYVSLSLLYIGLLADIEHSFAVLCSVPFAARLAGSSAVSQRRATGREQRLLFAVGFAAVGLLALAVRLFPGEGPTGSTPGGDGGAIAVRCLVLAAGLGVAVMLYRRPRAAWWAAIALGAAQVVYSLIVVALAAGRAATGGLLADAPLAAVDGLVMVVFLVLLARNRAVLAAPS